MCHSIAANYRPHPSTPLIENIGWISLHITTLWKRSVRLSEAPPSRHCSYASHAPTRLTAGILLEISQIISAFFAPLHPSRQVMFISFAVGSRLCLRNGKDGWVNSHLIEPRCQNDRMEFLVESEGDENILRTSIRYRSIHSFYMGWHSPANFPRSWCQVSLCPVSHDQPRFRCSSWILDIAHEHAQSEGLSNPCRFRYRFRDREYRDTSVDRGGSSKHERNHDLTNHDLTNHET